MDALTVSSLLHQKYVLSGLLGALGQSASEGGLGLGNNIVNNKVTDALKSEIDNLVDLSEKLAKSAASSDDTLGSNRIAELGEIVVRGGELIRCLYPANSQYWLSLQRIIDTPHFASLHSMNYSHVSELAGILKGVQHDINSGMLLDIHQLLQADIFADFLEMAEYLQSENYKDAAAVIVGAVLEDSLRKLATNRNILTTASNGKPLTIEPINVALAKDGVYSPLIQKQITTWANLRNDAAHGHFDKYDADQVKQMLLFVQKFCTDYLQ